MKFGTWDIYFKNLDKKKQEKSPPLKQHRANFGTDDENQSDFFDDFFHKTSVNPRFLPPAFFDTVGPADPITLTKGPSMFFYPSRFSIRLR